MHTHAPLHACVFSFSPVVFHSEQGHQGHANWELGLTVACGTHKRLGMDSPLSHLGDTDLLIEILKLVPILVPDHCGQIALCCLCVCSLFPDLHPFTRVYDSVYLRDSAHTAATTHTHT
jgi:hypothetical protein